MGRALCAKMKELLARQQADVAVQAARQQPHRGARDHQGVLPSVDICRA